MYINAQLLSELNLPRPNQQMLIPISDLPEYHLTNSWFTGGQEIGSKERIVIGDTVSDAVQCGLFCQTVCSALKYKHLHLCSSGNGIVVATHINIMIKMRLLQLRDVPLYES